MGEYLFDLFDLRARGQGVSIIKQNYRAWTSRELHN